MVSYKKCTILLTVLAFSISGISACGDQISQPNSKENPKTVSSPKKTEPKVEGENTVKDYSPDKNWDSNVKVNEKDLSFFGTSPKAIPFPKDSGFSEQEQVLIRKNLLEFLAKTQSIRPQKTLNETKELLAVSGLSPTMLEKYDNTSTLEKALLSPIGAGTLKYEGKTYKIVPGEWKTGVGEIQFVTAQDDTPVAKYLKKVTIPTDKGNLEIGYSCLAFLKKAGEKWVVDSLAFSL